MFTSEGELTGYFVIISDLGIAGELGEKLIGGDGGGRSGPLIDSSGEGYTRDSQVGGQTSNLPAGWEQHRRKSDGMRYFYHRKSRKSQWDFPQAGEEAGEGRASEAVIKNM